MRSMLWIWLGLWACGGDATKDEGADTGTPATTESWWGDATPPDAFCTSHGQAVAAGATCSDANAEYEESACLDSYLAAYEDGCIDDFLAWLSCADAEGTFTCEDDTNAAYDYADVCTAELAAYMPCVQ
ncbi:MAG: hypothetical protein ACI8PZ_002463 [Myxococcota bacterium]|jgi:hypothetical protein